MDKKTVKNKNTRPLTSFYYILSVLFIVIAAALTTYRISGDDDIFWHLETGKYIIDNKTIPSADVFGFVTSGSEWVPFEWGWDVLSYQIYSAAGYAGLTIFTTIVFILTFLIFFRLILKLKAGTILPVLIFLLLLFGMLDRLSPKPQIISYLFISLLLYIFISSGFYNRGNMKLFYFLPLIFLVWCNMHMGVLAGIGLFVIFIFSESINFVRQKNRDPSINYIQKKKQLIKFFLLFALSLITLFINPHGVKTYAYVYSHLNMKMLEDVFEWYSPFNKVFSGSMYFYIYIFFLASVMTVAYTSYKKGSLFIMMVSILFAAFSLNSARFSIDFMLVQSLLLALTVCHQAAGSKNRFLEFLHTSKLPAMVLTAVLAAFLWAIPSGSLYAMLNYQRSFGYGINDTDYPVKMTEFIKKNNLQLRISRPFNSFGIGGYIIFNLKGTKNFIDSRNLNDDIYYKYKKINNRLPGFESVAEQFGFDSFIWHYPGLVNNSIELQTSVLNYLINNNDRWKLVYWDDNSFIFLKNEDKFRDIIDKYEYKYVNPLYYIFQKEPLKNALAENNEEVVKELVRKYEDEPDGSFINSMMRSFKVPVNR